MMVSIRENENNCRNERLLLLLEDAFRGSPTVAGMERKLYGISFDLLHGIEIDGLTVQSACNGIGSSW